MRMRGRRSIDRINSEEIVIDLGSSLLTRLRGFLSRASCLLEPNEQGVERMSLHAIEHQPNTCVAKRLAGCAVRAVPSLQACRQPPAGRPVQSPMLRARPVSLASWRAVLGRWRADRCHRRQRCGRRSRDRRRSTARSWQRRDFPATAGAPAAGSGAGAAADHVIAWTASSRTRATAHRPARAPWKSSGGAVDLVLPKPVLAWAGRPGLRTSHTLAQRAALPGGSFPGAMGGASSICSHTELIPQHQECADAEDGYQFWSCTGT
jgi:hypothetical protein